MNLMQSILAIKEDVKDTQSKLDALINQGGEILTTIELGEITDGMYSKMVDFVTNYGDAFTTIVNDQIVSCKVVYDSDTAKLQCYTNQSSYGPKHVDEYQQFQGESDWIKSYFTLSTFQTYCEEQGIDIPTGSALPDYYNMDSLSDWQSSDDLQEFARSVEPYLFHQFQSFIDSCFVVTNLSDVIVAYANDNQATQCNTAIKSINGTEIPVQDLLNSICDASQMQDFMRIICDCLSSGETNVTKLSAILTNTANSYSPEVASMIQGFFASVPTDNSQGIASALIALYSNMNKTQADQYDSSLEFYQDNYLSATLFNSVWNIMYTAASAIISAVSYVISPILGAAVTGINQLVTWTREISENEDFIINESSMNRGFGVPLGQFEYNSNDRSHPFASHAVVHNSVCVQTPLFYYNVWTVEGKVRYEAFPVLLYSKQSLRDILVNYLGFTDNANDSYTRQDQHIHADKAAIWVALFNAQDEGAFQRESYANKLYVIRALWILSLLLGNDVWYANSRIGQFLPAWPGSTYGQQTVSVGNSLNFFLNNSSITTWNGLYTIFTTYYSNPIGSAIFNDADPDYHLTNWYDDAYIPNVSILAEPIVWFYGIMFDRNIFFVTPPKWQRGSLAWAIGITVALTAAIIVSSIAIKKSIRRKMRIKYAEIASAQSNLENSIGVASKTEIRRMVKNIDKKTAKYNLLAGLFGYSKLSYLNGWESGDSGMIQNPNRFTSNLDVKNGATVTLADLLALIK